MKPFHGFTSFSIVQFHSYLVERNEFSQLLHDGLHLFKRIYIQCCNDPVVCRTDPLHIIPLFKSSFFNYISFIRQAH